MATEAGTLRAGEMDFGDDELREMDADIAGIEKRKRNLFIIVGVLIVLVVATAVEVGVRLPDIPVASNVVVIALFNLNLIVFLLLLVLLFRNLAKVWFERKQNVLGARFRRGAFPVCFLFRCDDSRPALLRQTH